MKTLILVALTFTFLFVIACGGEASPSTTKVSTFSPITFTGSDGKTTPPFTVTTKEWIVEWTYTPKDDAPGMHYFAIVIWERGKDKFVVWQLPESTYGSTYCYAGAGDYYLEVGAVGIKEWQITIKPPE